MLIINFTECCEKHTIFIGYIKQNDENLKRARYIKKYAKSSLCKQEYIVYLILTEKDSEIFKIIVWRINL